MYGSTQPVVQVNRPGNLGKQAFFLFFCFFVVVYFKKLFLGSLYFHSCPQKLHSCSTSGANTHTHTHTRVIKLVNQPPIHHNSQSGIRAGRQSVGRARRGNSWPPLSTHWGYLAWHPLLATDITLPNAACGRTDGQAVPGERGEGRDRARKLLLREVSPDKNLGWVSLKALQSSPHHSGAGGTRRRKGLMALIRPRETGDIIL